MVNYILIYIYSSVAIYIGKSLDFVNDFHLQFLCNLIIS